MNNRRIFIASDVKGVGEWIESEGLSLEELEDEVARIAGQSDEWLVADYEGYEGLLDGEPSLSTVADVEAAISMLPVHLSDNLDAFAAYAENIGGDLEDAAMSFEDAYEGEYGTEEEYAEELLNEKGDLDRDSFLARYFDLEGFTRDLFISDYFAVDNAGGVFVFCNI